MASAPPTASLGQRIVDQARTYLSVPWFHAGRSRHGLDCAGLIAVVAHDLSITDFDDVNYPPEPDPAYLTAVLERFAERQWHLIFPEPSDPPLEFGDLRALPGDLLQFEILGEPRHVGIYAEDSRGRGTVIHTYQSVGRVCEHAFDVHWQRRLWAAYRFRET